VEAQELSRKYAGAVFSQALEPWLVALRTVQEKLADDSALAAGLANSDRSFAERQKELDQIIPKDSNQYVRNFFYVMLKEGDIQLLGDVLAELDRMTRGGPQVQVAIVTTALPLSDGEKDQLRQSLRKKYGEGLEFTFKVDSSIVGGVVVQVGDKIIDGSVQTRLQSMSNLLGVK